MKRSLFGKKPSREEIEREVTEQIEALVRGGDKPPPPSWTLAGGLPVDGPETGDGPSPPAPPAPSPPTAEADVVEEDDVADDEVAAPGPARAGTKRARAGASRSTAKRSAAPRAARAASGGRSRSA